MPKEGLVGKKKGKKKAKAKEKAVKPKKDKKAKKTAKEAESSGDVCPGCKKHCPLTALKCGKGRKLLRERKGQ